ncbi:hypothetical protein M4951_25615 [Blastopirellula sp. J2-11]|uniref:hypothetical protein n=1 Tax=Blastopirellula sp. J2-11 TaxID=2943192 RepID=UPI0021C87DD5|nr:hypothetical protein [Blastopirellula sp. J2-11]UUO06708.1 hypothetical protein M4951_25615 [Blastopirellula sp. J2-11]
MRTLLAILILLTLLSTTHAANVPFRSAKQLTLPALSKLFCRQATPRWLRPIPQPPVVRPIMFSVVTPRIIIQPEEEEELNLDDLAD